MLLLSVPASVANFHLQAHQHHQAFDLQRNPDLVRHITSVLL